jgi:diketogulonate reductase-like aldo/keto reductase
VLTSLYVSCITGTQPDLLLLHNPFVYPEGKLKEFWQILEGLVDSGELTASLGVSNFRPQDIEELLSFARIKPVVNQLEFHPWVLNHLDPVLALHEKYGIHTEAYGPLVPVLKAKTGGALGPVLKRISDRLTKETGKDIDPATVLLLWTRAKGVTAVTSSGNDGRIKKLGVTARLPDLLTKEEVEEIEREGRKTHFRSVALRPSLMSTLCRR